MSEIKENTQKQQIRNGLVNYIGALVQALPYEKDMAKHIINSIHFLNFIIFKLIIIIRTNILIIY